jgi:hypothetical protein
VQEGQPDRIADLLEEAADALSESEWVGLTNEEIADAWKTEYFNLSYELPRAIEAKLKEKNCAAPRKWEYLSPEEFNSIKDKATTIGYAITKTEAILREKNT